MRSTRPAAGLLGLAVLLAACGSGGTAATAAPATPAPTTAAVSAAPAAPDATDADLALASTSLGEVLVDGAGLTLYMFTADSPGKSACAGDCLASWPPLLVDGEPVLGDGVDAALVSTITRDDGATQLAYKDMALYVFAGDKAPGDVTGQGVGGKWFVVAADGSVVE